MDLQDNTLQGVEQLVEKYRKKFRIPENLNHYTEEDYRAAEKQFVKFCLKHGCVMKTYLFKQRN